jgi:electron transfer flavoprotein alpha subunit
MSGILVVLEQRAGRIAPISFEAISAAQMLGSQLQLPLIAALLGPQTEIPSQAVTESFDKFIRVEHPLLASYTADGFTIALQQLIEKEHPHYVVFSHTYQVRDYAPALATRFGQVLISDVVAIGAGPVFTRQLLQGRLRGTYRHAAGGACFLSVQAGAFQADSILYQGTTSVLPKPQPKNDEALATVRSSSAPISIFTPTLNASQIRTRPSEPFRPGTQTVDLTSAQRIVSVGRGIKEAANILIVQELATALGAELAASRPICDDGWLSLDRQVGSSGQTVAPKLYVAVGISGAIQHQVGMKGSQCIVAINKDPDAPIFEIADYGIVGDLFEVVPALTAAVKAAKP